MMQKMRYLTILLIIVCLLGACSKESLPVQTTVITTVPETTAEPTQPPIPWIEAEGMPWDEDGLLLELPLTIPDGLHYQNVMEFGGDLLLWSIDDHFAERYSLELCLVDLSTGQVTAQRDLSVSQYVSPQVLNGGLYICDANKGLITKLDKSLDVAEQWSLTPNEGEWFMGGNDTVYQFLNGEKLYAVSLSTQEKQAVLDGDPDVWAYISNPGIAQLEYYRTDTGAKNLALLDLSTGSVLEPPMDGKIHFASYYDGVWMFAYYGDQNSYYLFDGENLVTVATGNAYLDLLPGKRLLLTGMECNELFLYDLQGKLISQCHIYDENGYYNAMCLTYSPEFNGYFIWLSAEGAGGRLLFWDISKSVDADDLQMEPIPSMDEARAELENRVDSMSVELGVNILIGTQCDTYFDDFTASQVTDTTSVNLALDTLCEALSSYPDGFIRQLRFDNVHGITIQLVSNLIATGSGREGDGYIAFAQQMYDHYLVVIDIDDVGVDTYYHEFSHIIDSFLAWDALQREDALFSEDAWCALNPGWFDGYTYDYSWEQNVEDYSWFIDSYSTISPTEDRARVMEYAMSEFGSFYFADNRGLKSKLDYYCQCIRDAFDTTGWDETVLWEQYN